MKTFCSVPWKRPKLENLVDLKDRRFVGKCEHDFVLNVKAKLYTLSVEAFSL